MMTPARQQKTAGAARFRVGDRVRFHWGDGMVNAIVLEDRGPIGVGGRRFYHIEAQFDPYNTERFSIPGDDLEKVE